MNGDMRVDALMRPVEAAIMRHVKDHDAAVDIYNRAYEAVMDSMDALDVSAKVTARQIAENASNLQRAEKAEAEAAALRERMSLLEHDLDIARQAAKGHQERASKFKAALADANADAERLAKMFTYIDRVWGETCVHCDSEDGFQGIETIKHDDDCPITLHRARVGGTK